MQLPPLGKPPANKLVLVNVAPVGAYKGYYASWPGTIKG
jgi:hypothetical protein